MEESCRPDSSGHSSGISGAHPQQDAPSIAIRPDQDLTTAISQQHHQQRQEHDIKRPRGIRSTTIRNYKLFPGNNVFFCGGRFMTHRAYWAFGLSLFLLVAPSVLFVVFL